MNDAFENALRLVDERVRAAGLNLWIGGEPTFTRRQSQAPAWLGSALGDDKTARAEAFTIALHRATGGFILRSIGRQYPGEDRPRWSYGILRRRRPGPPLWTGPPDPLIAEAPGPTLDPAAFLDRLAAGAEPFERLEARGIPRLAVGERDRRLLPDSLLRRPLLEDMETPPEGLRDPLAEGGCQLYLCRRRADGVLELELPAFSDSAAFDAALRRIEAAAQGLGALVLSGHPPPSDAERAWTTVTPDPGVVEVNMAPAEDLIAFLASERRIDAAARESGLSARRFAYNGEVSGSGGGGHLTLGGPSARASPFVRFPRLLPALLLIFQRRPSLSYLFATRGVGSACQAPRPDENVRQLVLEYRLALARLLARPAPDPETLWRSLAPFLVDASGNNHRAELNIEKLWNPYLPGRGTLGVVELRSLRMAPSPEGSAALGALFRALVACVHHRGEAPDFHDWGDELHDRFALPFYLQRDIRELLAELEDAGFGLPAPILDELLAGDPIFGIADLGDARLEVRPALEFWPLLGDAASQEQGNSRMIDPSTRRVELRLSGARAGDWSLQVGPWRLPLREEPEARVIGLRYRSFEPRWAVHPGLAVTDPVELIARRGEEAFRIELFSWRPDGEAYDGLPEDTAEAARRRGERFRVSRIPAGDAPEGREPPKESRTPHCLDLRWMM